MPSRRPTLAQVLTHPASFVATLGGLGLFRWGPGTVGSLAAFPLYLLLIQAPTNLVVPLWGVLLILAWWASSACARYTGIKDPGFIIIDETVSLLAVLHFLPLSLEAWLLAFGIFRFYDILKPWPIRYFDTHFSGGTGIMLDDLAAAGATWATCYLLLLTGIVPIHHPF